MFHMHVDPGQHLIRSGFFCSRRTRRRHPPNFNHNLAAKTANFTAPWEEGGQTKYAGKPAFIVGGSSSVGQYGTSLPVSLCAVSHIPVVLCLHHRVPAIQVAKYSGYSPIITTASLHNEALLKSLGANAVLDRKLPASFILHELQKLAGGKPLEYVFDAISAADTQTLAYDALAPGGTLFIVLNDEIPEDKKKAGGDKRVVHGFGSVHVPENREIGVQLFSRLTEWLETGVIVVRTATCHVCMHAWLRVADRTSVI